MSDGSLRPNLEAERAVLGACLLDADAFPAAAEVLTPADFFRVGHQVTFRAMHRLRAKGAVLDLVTVKNELTPAELSEAGGPVYLGALIDGVPRSTNVSDYARAVKERAEGHRVIVAARHAETLIHEGVTPATVAETLQQRLQEIQGVGADDAADLPPFESLRVRLARPVEPIRFAIDSIHPRHARVMLVAQYKAGKTTFVTNYVQSWADGDPFLGLFAIAPNSGAIVVLDFEMSEHQSDGWYRAVAIRRDDRVIWVPMRGKAALFNILDRRTRTRWARALRQLATTNLILDCLRPVLDALGLDEHKDAGRFLVAFDALLDEAGITEAVVVQHMGHANERARGDSRLQDWPDAIWSLVRKSDDPSSARYFKAFGRDVDVPESQVQFDPETRRLFMVGGSRADARTDGALRAVVDVLQEHGCDGMTGRAIWAALRDSDHARQTVADAVTRGVESGVLLKSDGPRKSFVYRVSHSAPSVSRSSVSECPAAYIRRDTRTLSAFPSSVPVANGDDLIGGDDADRI